MKSKIKHSPFTLMEMVVVIAIIALLATVVTPMYFKHVDKAKKVSAQTQVKFIEGGIMDYELDLGRLPISLDGLLQNDAGSNKWDGPYLNTESLPKDPWGNSYQYEAPGKTGKKFDLYSYGPKGPSAREQDYIKN